MADEDQESADGDGQNQYGGGDDEIDAVEQTERAENDESDADE